MSWGMRITKKDKDVRRGRSLQHLFANVQPSYCLPLLPSSDTCRREVRSYRKACPPRDLVLGEAGEGERRLMRRHVSGGNAVGYW
jgi:hypothetical protein